MSFITASDHPRLPVINKEKHSRLLEYPPARITCQAATQVPPFTASPRARTSPSSRGERRKHSGGSTPRPRPLRNARPPLVTATTPPSAHWPAPGPFEGAFPLGPACFAPAPVPIATGTRGAGAAAPLQRGCARSALSWFPPRNGPAAEAAHGKRGHGGRPATASTLHKTIVVPRTPQGNTKKTWLKGAPVPSGCWIYR